MISALLTREKWKRIHFRARFAMRKHLYFHIVNNPGSLLLVMNVLMYRSGIRGPSERYSHVPLATNS